MVVTAQYRVDAPFQERMGIDGGPGTFHVFALEDRGHPRNRRILGGHDG
jgi:hypothetical protein